MIFLFLIFTLTSFAYGMKDESFKGSSLLERKFKRTKEDVEPLQESADMTFLRAVHGGEPAVVLPYFGKVNLDAKAPSVNQIEPCLRGQSALSIAVREGHMVLAALLIARGASMHQHYSIGGNLLLMSVQRALDIPWYGDDWQLIVDERIQMVKLLLTQSTNLREQDAILRSTPVHLCAEYLSGKYANTKAIGAYVYEKLLESNFLSMQKMIDRATIRNELAVLCFIPDRDGKTPLDKACTCAHKSGIHEASCSAHLLHSEQLVERMYNRVSELKAQPAKFID